MKKDHATRPTLAEIDLRAIRWNLRFIQSLVGPNVTVMPVVKANAYGHGLRDVSVDLARRGYPMFGVAFPEEGARLREAGVDADVHVFALASREQAELCVRHRLEPTIGNDASLREVSRAAARAKRTVDCHIKVETGMNRIGFRPHELASLLRSLAGNRRIRVRGVYTHFATSDEPRSRFVRRQLQVFADAVELLRREGLVPELVHAANSGAILRHPDAHFDMVRAGILMYGISPAGPDDPLSKARPAMTLRTTVAQVKRIRTGESVSYGRHFRARRPTTIVTLPIGYADGLFRALSGRAEVLINGRRHPLVGRICMDQCMADAGNTDVRTGDPVVIIGRQGGASISAWELARAVRTIPYELTCAVSARVPRSYVR